MKNLVVIVGPTAVGKTSLAIKLANYFQTEILSADSRQFFRETEIGTAKPTKDELAQATHHFINTLSIKDDYNAGTYELEALEMLTKLFHSLDTVVMVGGSGLYIKAVCEGMDEMPEIDPAIRQRLNTRLKEEGLNSLTTLLQLEDPEYYNLVDLKNPQRVIRALEIIEATGQKYSLFRTLGNRSKTRPFTITKIGLEMPREILYERINQRMDEMILAGLFQEAEALYKYKHFNALQTVGYSEIFNFLDGKYHKEEAIRLLKRNSRRYAKRQMTWFKKDESIRWFTPDQYDSILDYLQLQLGV